MSIALVAQKAGVSQATVSYVINNKPVVSEQTAARVKKAIKELGYIPRASRWRSGLNTGYPKLKSGNIGLAIPDGAMSLSQLNTRLFEAVHKDLERRSLRLIPVRMAKRCSLQETISNNNTFKDLDGILLLYYTLSLDITRPLSIPCVSVLGHPDPITPLICDHVEPDNIRIGAIASKYLSDKGHRYIAVIKPSTRKHAAIDIRCQQFSASADYLNIKSDIYHIPLKLRDRATHNPANITGNHPLAKLISKLKAMPGKPTGIFVPSDSHLSIIFNAFRQAGIEPGKDVDFIGCNNESIIHQSLSPAPATIDIKPDIIARKAIDILLKRIADINRAEASYTTTYVEPALVEFKM